MTTISIPVWPKRVADRVRGCTYVRDGVIGKAMGRRCDFGILCIKEGCNNVAKGDGNGGKATKCVRHGGGPRCTEEDCNNSAQHDGKGGKATKCKRHGGGPRCTEEDCNNSAMGDGKGGKATKCIRHGGGPRCTEEDCNNSAQHDGRGGKATKCVRHGGGPRCIEEGCNNLAKGDGKGGKATKCKRHGGGPRCSHKDHAWASTPPVAHFRSLDNEPLCCQHYYLSVNRSCRAIRKEILVLGNLLGEMPRLLGMTHEEFGAHYLGNDFNVSSCKLLRRPDMLFLFDAFAILIEIDEHSHRGRTELSELEHIDVIRRWLSDEHDMPYLYVLRVNPDGCRPMFRKVARPIETTRVLDKKYSQHVFEPTEYCHDKMAIICTRASTWIHSALRGEIPHPLRKASRDPAQQGVFTEWMFFDGDRPSAHIIESSNVVAI